MVDFFGLAVQRLLDVGFYNFLLPFILFVTLFYAVLRRTSLIGDSVVMQGVLSVVLGLFVFGAPVILGINLVQPLTAFITQGAVALLVFLFGFLVASFFYPNIMEKLPEIFKTPGPATWLIWTIFGFGVAFGLFVYARQAVENLVGAIGAPPELLTLTVVVLAVFFVFLLVTMGRPTGE